MLFDTNSRMPRVTPKGREVLAVCEQFLHLAKELETAAGGLPAVGGLVRVGAADTVALTWLPALMSRLGKQYPQIDVELIVDLSLHLQTRLENREIDIAFLVGPISKPEITTRHLGDVRTLPDAKRVQRTDAKPDGPDPDLHPLTGLPPSPCHESLVRGAWRSPSTCARL